MKMIGGKTSPFSVGISINFTFSLIKSHCKNARRYTSHLAMPHYVRGNGDSEVWRVLVCPMRSCKGNGLNKGFWNKTAVLTTELTEQRLCCLWRICQVILDFSYYTLLICLYSFRLRSQSLKLPLCFLLWTSIGDTAQFETAVHSPTGWCKLVWIIRLMHNF